MRPPTFDFAFEDLPSDLKARHEVLVDLFGDYLFWVQRQALSRIHELIESETKRSELGSMFRGVYDQAAALKAEDREILMRLLKSGIASFAGLFLTMISGQGFDDTLGPNYVFRYRLDMEICDAETGEVVLEETINRGGRKFFPEYWGRWLNRYESQLAARRE